ncbi:MAG: copper resistance protein CopC [Ktedonobacteraceae bacterium]|nr:copper resistance protein CopC [Ktedonobacteraceae bacterium]
MKVRAYLAATRRLVPIALLLAISIVFLFPGVSEAHAILLRSDPTKDAVLQASPSRVQMWFSEDLNSTFSTAAVVNGNNQRVDRRDARVSSSDPREMDVSLAPNLPPAVYIVIWRSDSNDDGHVLSGSFLFKVANPDVSVPDLPTGAAPGQNVLGSSNLSGLYTGQLDAPGLFNLIMITLVELAAIFWVGAQLWLFFVLQAVTDVDEKQDQYSLPARVQRRFDQRFSLLILLVLLLANVGVLVGQAINVTAGQWAAALSPALLAQLASSGRFGTFWLMRETVIMLALAIALFMLFAKNRAPGINKILPWLNLVLGLALFMAISMSSHASAVSANMLVYAVLIDWLHLLGAAFWVGGMLYIALIYLPVLRSEPVGERAHSLISILPYFTPWAIVGVTILTVTGPFSAALHLTSVNQLITTAYGRVLVIKVLLVGALMLTSAVHVGLLRPRLKKEYKKYAYALERAQSYHASQEAERAPKLITQQVKLREQRLTKRTLQLSSVLRWEPVLGVAVLVCVGLMNIFAGTLSPIAAPQPVQQPTAHAKPFNQTVTTSDGKFRLLLTITPNRFGPNVFTVTVIDPHTGKPTTNAGVTIYTTMLDMDMGTDTLNLQLDGHGHFSGSGDLGMSGNWRIGIQVRTPDNTLHRANVEIVTPF